MTSDVLDLQKWTVIVNTSLTNSDIFRLLSEKFKVRVSSSTVVDSIIFPMSGVIFQYISVGNSATKNSAIPDDEIENRISKMLELHKNCFLLLKMSNSSLLTTFCQLQQRFLGSRLMMIPIHTEDEATESMINVAKALYKLISTILWERLDHLFGSQWSDEHRIMALKVVRLSEHECNILLDSLGSLSQITRLSVEELMNATQNKELSNQISNFFMQDSISF